MLSEKNHGIKAAYDELAALNNDEERRAIYQAREKAIMDYNVQNPVAREERARKEGIKEGIEKGKIEGKIEIAKEMFISGAEMSFVLGVTKLPKEILLNIKEEVEG